MANSNSLRGKPIPADGDLALFLSRWIRTPLRIGAVVPSSPRLAREMARAIDTRSPRHVIELGGGTGSITRALLDAGVAAERLVVIENDKRLARLLRHRFPHVHVIHGDARDMLALVRPLGVTSASGVVSGLPLISMPIETQKHIIAQSFALLGREGAFVQFTYGPVSPVLAPARTHLHAEVTGRVWRNFPPASVWRYRLHGSARAIP